MAGIDTHAGERRTVTHDIPLVPFIDFLLCLVAFLLVTAVWSVEARIDADARVPGTPGPTPPKEEPVLHVEMRGERSFQLVWRSGETVVNSTTVPRRAVDADDQPTFPDLAERVSAEWTAQGAHRSAGDAAFDRAVLHTDHSTEFGEIVAVLDAIATPTRDRTVDGKPQRVPAFAVAFATD